MILTAEVYAKSEYPTLHAQLPSPGSTVLNIIFSKYIDNLVSADMLSEA